MTIISKSEEETEKTGERLAASLEDSTVIALYGDLGAGKTAFVRGLAKGLGLTARVTSPTFTIVNDYSGKLFHFDMYRLSGSDELFDIGWEDYLDSGGICAVEWSENIQDAFTGDEIQVHIKKLSGDSRQIEITGVHIKGDIICS